MSTRMGRDIGEDLTDWIDWTYVSSLFGLLRRSLFSVSESVF